MAALRTWWRAWCSPPSSFRRAWPTRELAGLPPVTGLYTTIACLVGYARVRPVARARARPGLLGVAADLRRDHAAVVSGDDPARAIALAGMLALLVGLIEIGLGLGRLGFVADLLSSEVQVGYMNGLGITIIVGQLPKLFGFSTDADSFLDEVRAFVERHRRDATRRRSSSAWRCSSCCSCCPASRRRVPAVLVAVVGATVVVGRARPARHGVATVGSLPQGVPAPVVAVDQGRRRAPLLIAAVGITLVSLTDTIATATSFAARRGDEVDPNQEMIGIGAANVAAGLFQGLRGVDERLAHGGRRAVRRRRAS